MKIGAPVPHLAPAARRERDVLVANRAKLLESGRASAEEIDGAIEAWRLIAELMANGSAETLLSFSTLHLFTSRAMASLDAQVQRTDPAPPELIERRNLVDAIHQRIAHAKFMLDDATTIARETAKAAREAA